MLTLCGEQRRHIAKQKQCLENLKEEVEAHRARQVSLFRHPSHQQNRALVTSLEACIGETPPSLLSTSGRRWHERPCRRAIRVRMSCFADVLRHACGQVGHDDHRWKEMMQLMEQIQAALE